MDQDARRSASASEMRRVLDELRCEGEGEEPVCRDILFVSTYSPYQSSSFSYRILPEMGV
jgi:hypothetical protein